MLAITAVQAEEVLKRLNNGEVKAIGAGRNRVLRGNNYAKDFRRQIGSTAKPLFDYALGIEELNWSTGTMFLDDAYTLEEALKQFKDKTYKYLNELLHKSR